MRTEYTRSAALLLIGLVLLVGCGESRATPAPFTPVATVGPPTPNPAVLAAGAKLRALLLTQIDEAERQCRMVLLDPNGECRIFPSGETLPATSLQPPELTEYARWYNAITQCRVVEDPTRGVSAIAMTAIRGGTPAQLRDPLMLDGYTTGLAWCGMGAGR